ncbi:MAG: hypothetical protein LAP40_26735, partial [Acidobacteriia bacterium]|nr:hypothetical protein [Terriglobia bacterium]
QLPQFFPIFVCDINSEGWTGHTQSMPQNIFEWNCFIRTSSGGQRTSLTARPSAADGNVDNGN